MRSAPVLTFEPGIRLKPVRESHLVIRAPSSPPRVKSERTAAEQRRKRAESPRCRSRGSLPRIASRGAPAATRVNWRTIHTAICPRRQEFGVVACRSKIWRSADSRQRAARSNVRAPDAATRWQILQCCDAMYGLPHHQSCRLGRESDFQNIAVLMNSNAVFVGFAGLQIKCMAAYPA